MEKTEEHGKNLSYTFPKSEKLCSLKDIEELFKKGSSHFLYPFRLVYLLPRQEASRFPKLLISIPKKNFKRAVDRNRLKRQIRESYRLHRQGIFLDMPISKIPESMGIIFVGKEKMPYNQLEKKLILILTRLKNT